MPENLLSSKVPKLEITEYSTGYKLLEHLESYKTDARISPVTGEPTTPLGVHIILPEPIFTQFLQYCKMLKIQNVWTNNIIQFDDVIDGLHFRCSCKGESRMSERQIKGIIGFNAL